MANTNYQINGTPQYGDFPFVNYGGTDLPAGVAVLIDSTNVLGGASGANDGVGVALPGADGALVVGVTMEIIKANGGTGRVRCSGIAAMTCSATAGAITAGGAVMAEATTGKAKASGAAKAQVGVALNTTVNGDTVLVLVAPANNA